MSESQPTNVTPNFLLLGSRQVGMLSADALAKLSTLTQTVPGGISEEDIESIIAPLLNPTGVWADYNPTLRLYQQVIQLALKGLVPFSMIPPPPRIQDYTNLTAPRSPLTACEEHSSSSSEE